MVPHDSKSDLPLSTYTFFAWKWLIHNSFKNQALFYLLLAISQLRNIEEGEKSLNKFKLAFQIIFFVSQFNLIFFRWIVRVSDIHIKYQVRSVLDTSRIWQFQKIYVLLYLNHYIVLTRSVNILRNFVNFSLSIF